MARILVVEDDIKINKLVCTKLQGRGFDVAGCYNGADALEYLKTEKPDLILSDVMMPRMTGFELLENVRKDENLKSIPFILLTSVSQEDDVVRGLEMGANDYMVKPFSFPELLARIRKWVPA